MEFKINDQEEFEKSQNSQHVNTSEMLLQKISRQLAPCYKIYSTDNLWIFLELETFSGRIWQLQYSINEKKVARGKVGLNYNALVSDEEQYTGRFELHKTHNMYNFILLDNESGRTWQVQWSLDDECRGIIEI